MNQSRRRGGTATPRPLDPGQAARAFRMAGIDPRHWLSYGTVCTLNEDGSTNFSDGSAIHVSPTGVTVDVLLMPANQHVPCRYSGVQGGASGTIFTPIHPGDEVVVGIPDGDLRLPPVILAVMSGEHSPLPLDTDRTPVFKNDRVLVNAADVPVEIRASGGKSVMVNQDGTIQLGKQATEQLVLGTEYRNKEGQMDQAISSALSAVQTAAQAFSSSGNAEFTALTGSTGVPMPTTIALLNAVSTFIPLWKQAVDQFEQGADRYLSNVSKTE